MLEAKGKDLALLRLRDELAALRPNRALKGRELDSLAAFQREVAGLQEL